MSQEPDNKRFLKNPSLLIDLCREVIDQLDNGADDPEIGEKEAQLREISRTIDRLDKLGVAVPEALRAEKTRLAAALGTKTEGLQALNHLADEFEGLLKDIKVRLGKDGGPNESKKLRAKHSRSPKTEKKILREHIIRALKKLGGRARMADVLNEMERQLSGKLLPRDLEVHKDGKSIVWQNSAQWERFRMIKEGMLRSNSRHGYWELNEDQK